VGIGPGSMVDRDGKVRGNPYRCGFEFLVLHHFPETSVIQNNVNDSV
jgi:hypothetical protein